MKNVFKDKPNISVKKSIQERNKLMYPFIKKFKNPILVHSVKDQKTFLKILSDKKLKKPENHNSEKKLPYTEKILKIDNSIYFGLGFVYANRYNLTYSFLFKIDLLQQAEYYDCGICRRVYKDFADYLFFNDRKYLDVLINKSLTCKKIVEKYLEKEFNGKKRVFFNYWESEKEVYDWLRGYKNKRVTSEIIKNVKKKSFVSFPESLSHAKDIWQTSYVPEILSKKELDLIKSPYFLGFYIIGKIPKKIEKILFKDFKGKIIFNGKDIRTIN